MRTLAIALSLALAGTAGLLTLWLYLPAPDIGLWFYAVLLTELSAWLLVPVFVAAGLAVFVWIQGAPGWAASVWIVCALATYGAVNPIVQAWNHASTVGAHLSLVEYFNVTYAGDAARQPRTQTYASVEGAELKADIWQSPQTSGPPRPAIVLVHGGSWQDGNRGELARWAEWLNDLGFTVFDVDYRLAPPPRWKGAPSDVKCAVAWIKHRAPELGIDPTRVVLMGSSAGGHLALLAAYSDSRLPPGCPGTDTSVAGAIAISAPSDLTALFTYAYPWWYPDWIKSAHDLETFTGGTPETAPEAYVLGSPTTYVDRSAVPTLIVHGGRDQLVPPAQAQVLTTRLSQVGAPHRLVLIPHANHGFEFIWSGWGSQMTRLAVSDFLRPFR